MLRSIPGFALSVCLLAAGCSGGSNSPTSPTDRQPDGKVDLTSTLQPGQRVAVEGVGFALTFTGVTNDSRCPGDALCITSGHATARFEATLTARGAAQLELSTNDPKRAVDYADLRIELQELSPYPFANLGTIQPGDYRATVRIVSR